MGTQFLKGQTNNSCKATLGQTAASVCKPYLGVDQDQQYKITLIELKVLQILSFALIWPTQLCAVHGTVLGGGGVLDRVIVIYS